MSEETIVHTDDESFDRDVLQADLPVLVDFWAPWCGPCRMIAPILDAVAKEYLGKIKVVKLNVEDNQDVPARYGIRNIPTLKIFKDGREIATKVGSLGKPQLTAFIDSSVA